MTAFGRATMRPWNDCYIFHDYIFPHSTCESRVGFLYIIYINIIYSDRNVKVVLNLAINLVYCRIYIIFALRNLQWCG
jgi:hypothetical protein